MNGIILVDKPGEHTSFDVVARVRGILKMKKVGHGGTLDPMATGVLPVFLGSATKCCDILPNTTKRYIAEVAFGTETDTQDRTGTVIKTGGERMTESALRRGIGGLVGEYSQTPPMYSAVQVGGRRLYDLARQGIEVERAARQVEILGLDLLAFSEQEQTATLDITCSKGTYVRTLCCDIAKAQGALCTLQELRRTESSGFLLEDCVSLEALTELAARGEAESVLLPVQRAFGELPKIFLTAQQAAMLQNGVPIDTARTRAQTLSGPAAVFCEDGAFLAVGYIGAEGILERVKQFRE